MSCDTDLDPLLRDVTDPVTVMIQAMYRRAITSPGELIDDSEYGLGLLEMVSEEGTNATIIAARAKAEFEKDERVLSCVVVGSFVSETLTLDIRGLGAAGPFSFVLSVNDVTVALLRGE